MSMTTHGKWKYNDNLITLFWTQTCCVTVDGVSSMRFVRLVSLANYSLIIVFPGCDRKFPSSQQFWFRLKGVSCLYQLDQHNSCSILRAGNVQVEYSGYVRRKDMVYKRGNISFVLFIYHCIPSPNHLCQTDYSQRQNKHLSVYLISLPVTRLTNVLWIFSNKENKYNLTSFKKINKTWLKMWFSHKKMQSSYVSYWNRDTRQKLYTDMKTESKDY